MDCGPLALPPSGASDLRPPENKRGGLRVGVGDGGFTKVGVGEGNLWRDSGSFAFRLFARERCQFLTSFFCSDFTKPVRMVSLSSDFVPCHSSGVRVSKCDHGGGVLYNIKSALWLDVLMKVQGLAGCVVCA